MTWPKAQRLAQRQTVGHFRRGCRTQPDRTKTKVRWTCESSALAALFSSHPRLGSTLRPPGFLAAHDHVHTYAHKDSGLLDNHAAPAERRWVGGHHGRPCRWLCRCCVPGLRCGRPTLGPAYVHGPRSNLPAALMYHWGIPKPGPRGGALDRGVSWVQQVGVWWSSRGLLEVVKSPCLTDPNVPILLRATA